MFRITFALPLIVLILTLTACANQGRLRQQELSRVGDWLPGTYDNSAQVDEQLRESAANPYPSTQMTLLPVAAPFLGDFILYVETADTTGPRQVRSRQLYRFDKTADDKAIVQRVFEMKEPQRWARAQQHPEIFKSLLGDDVSATPPCDLLWKQEGEVFKGVAGRKGCPIRSMSFDGLELHLEPGNRPTGDFLRMRRVGAQ